MNIVCLGRKDASMAISHIRRLGHNPYVILHDKSWAIRDKFDCPVLVSSEYERIDRFLVDNRIRMAFVSPDTGMFIGSVYGISRPICSEVAYIDARNSLIDQHDLPINKIDIIFLEKGFVRHNNLLQLDNKGTSGLNSMREIHPYNLPDLTVSEDFDLNNWIDEYKHFNRVSMISKKDICDNLGLNPKKRLLFCPLQKERDTTVRYMSWMAFGLTGFMERLLRGIDLDLFEPVFKEHPKNRHPSSIYKWYKKYKGATIVPADYRVSTPQFINSCDCLATINSTASYEALMFNKPILVFGITCCQLHVFAGTRDNWYPKFLNQVLNGHYTEKDARKFLYTIIFKKSWEPSRGINEFKKVINSLCKYTQL